MRKFACLFLIHFVTFISFSQPKTYGSLNALLINHPTEDLARVDLLNVASIRIFKSDPEKSLQYAQEALALANRLAFPKGVLQANNNLAVYYLMKGKSETALKHAVEATQIGEREQSADWRADCYSILGTIYHNQRSFGKAILYLNKALALNPSNVLVKSRIYNSLGGIARDKKEYDSALLYYEMAIKIMKEGKDEYRMPEVINNIGIVYLRQGNLDTALKYLLESNEIAKATENLRAQILSSINIGNVLIEKRKYAEAEAIEFSALAMANKFGDKSKVLQVYISLATIKMETGKFHEAHQYMNEHYALKDSLSNDEKTRQIAEIETRYETEKKDQTIRVLEQQSKIKSLQQWYLKGTLLALIIVFTIFYFLQRSHHKKVIKLLNVQKMLNQKLRENDQLKSSFFANISHEFRTPLSLILAPIETKLSSPSLPEMDRESFQLVRRNANRLLVLINQLLDLSKLEAKKMELTVKQGDLKKFLLLAAASFDSFAETKGIHFQKNIHFNLKESWYDVDKLEKIIYNILFNAFKFTPAGGTIGYSVSQASDTNDLVLSITDTGKGIPENEQEYIFSPFYQSRYDADDGQPGTGLGLSLVKELVKLFQGDIKLVSTVGQGTSITITLPVTKERLPVSVGLVEINTEDNAAVLEDEFDQMSLLAQGAEVVVSEKKVRSHQDSILVVEDNEDMRNFISSTLQERFLIVTAKDGEEGFAAAIAHIPDLIISDVMMPNMNGVVLTDLIKNDERTSHIPIILLTAKTGKVARIEGFQKGVDDYIAKPFSMDELHVRITNLIEQRKKLAKKYKSILYSPSVPESLTMDERFLLSAKKIIELHIGDSNFGVEKMAEETNLSRAQLFRKLKAIAGISPNELINEIRLQRAAQLILSKVDTIAQIGYSVGFNEQSYFAKSFRKKFGVPPTEYAKKETA